MACFIFVLIGLSKQLSMKAASRYAGVQLRLQAPHPLAPRSSHSGVLFPVGDSVRRYPGPRCGLSPPSGCRHARTQTQWGGSPPGPPVGDGEHGELCLAGLVPVAAAEALARGRSRRVSRSATSACCQRR